MTEHVVVKDADQIAAHCTRTSSPSSRRGDRIVGAVDLHVAVGMHGALAAAKQRKGSAASGRSAGCSISTKCVHTWRRVVPWMRSRAIVRFQCRRNAFCASRLSNRRPFSALSLT